MVRLDTNRSCLKAGLTAVLEIGNVTALELSHTVNLFDRALDLANGFDPPQYDAIVVKSPHTEYAMYDAWAERYFKIDIPGATSANLSTQGHTACGRPIYPLNPDAVFLPKAVLDERRAA